jgi:glyoxylate/hydroxypyruvate reductase A
MFGCQTGPRSVPGTFPDHAGSVADAWEERMDHDAVHVLIASPLEAEFAARIAAVDRQLTVLYEPGLLPVPRYPADHSGTPRDLPAADLRRWSDLRQQADVSFDFDWQDPAAMARNCPRLLWVQGTSAGIGGLLQRTGLDKTALQFTTAAGVHGRPLAEFALLGLLYFAKDVPRLTQWKAERHWQRYASGQLAGSRALLVGLGGIGRQMAPLLSAAGIQVTGAGRPGHHYDVAGVTSYVTEPGEFDAALAATDALILACPLTEQTQGLIGAPQLALLRRGAVVINVSRGAVIDEAALVAALASGHLGGACLDVFATEPLPASSPLWDLPNVIISPHSASTAAAENALITDLFCDNLRRFLDGRPLRNVFDRGAGY